MDHSISKYFSRESSKPLSTSSTSEITKDGKDHAVAKVIVDTSNTTAVKNQLDWIQIPANKRYKILLFIFQITSPFLSTKEIKIKYIK